MGARPLITVRDFDGRGRWEREMKKKSFGTKIGERFDKTRFTSFVGKENFLSMLNKWHTLGTPKYLFFSM